MAAVEEKTGVMALAEMKKLLNGCSPENPLNCAVGIDGEMGLLELNKRVNSRALESKMKAESPKGKSFAFGTAVIDLENTKQINLTLNKPASGVAKRLIKTLKGTGYNKVKIMAPDENGVLTAEIAGDEEGVPSAAPPVQAPPPDPALLAKRLSACVVAIKETKVEATILAGLADLAKQSNINLKTNNLKTAADLIQRLETQLAQLKEASATSDAAAGGVLTKSRQIWIAAHKKVEGELDKLRGQIVNTYKDEPIAAELEARYKDRILPIVQNVTGKLGEKLLEANGAEDSTKREELVAEAKKIMADCQAFLSGHTALIADLDDNPFEKLAIQQTLGSTLAALNKMMA